MYADKSHEPLQFANEHNYIYVVYHRINVGFVNRIPDIQFDFNMKHWEKFTNYNPFISSPYKVSVKLSDLVENQDKFLNEYNSKHKNNQIIFNKLNDKSNNYDNKTDNNDNKTDNNDNKADNNDDNNDNKADNNDNKTDNNDNKVDNKLIADSKLGNDKSNGDNDIFIDFYVQSFHANELKYVNTAQHKLYNKSNDIVGAGLLDVVYGPSVKLITKFVNFCLFGSIHLQKSRKNIIYNWNSMNGAYYMNNIAYDRSINNLYGLQEYYDQITADVANYKNNIEKLIQLGKSNGLNYLLYGSPGTGKSSFIRVLSTTLGVPLYITNLGPKTTESNLAAMLSPNVINMKKKEVTQHRKTIDNFIIVLIEDFDRYLESSQHLLKGILNELDGISPAFNIIRFFTANDPNIISNNFVLCSRMHRTFLFDKPNKDHIGMLLKNTFPDNVHDVSLLNLTVNKLNGLNTTMRQITSFIARFLGSDNPLQDIVNNIEQWKLDEEKLNNYKDTISIAKANAKPAMYS